MKQLRKSEALRSSDCISLTSGSYRKHLNKKMSVREKLKTPLSFIDLAPRTTLFGLPFEAPDASTTLKPFVKAAQCEDSPSSRALAGWQGKRESRSTAREAPRAKEVEVTSVFSRLNIYAHPLPI